VPARRCPLSAQTSGPPPESTGRLPDGTAGETGGERPAETAPHAAGVIAGADGPAPAGRPGGPAAPVRDTGGPPREKPPATGTGQDPPRTGRKLPYPRPLRGLPGRAARSRRPAGARSAVCAGAALPARVRAVLREAGPALALFAAARLTGLLLMAAWALHIGKRPRAILGRAWDADWYMLIAEHGYGRVLTWPDGAVQSDLAFFPLYPALVRAGSAVLSPLLSPVLSLTSGTVGLLITWTAAALAAAGIHRLTGRLYGRRAATFLVLLWGLLPHSVVLTMAYTEPLLTAFAAWSLHALLTGRWVWAGVLSAAAGLSRPNGIAVAAAVVAAAGCELVRRAAAARGRPPGAAPAPYPAATRRICLGAALAPLGWCGYVLSVGLRTGDPLGGYFAVQRGWTSRFDFGAGALGVVRDMVLRPTVLPLVMALLVVVASVALFALLALERPPAALLVYTAVLVLITVGGSGFFESKPRFLLPAFPLLLPVALALARARRRSAVTVAASLAAVSFAYGTYLLTMSPIAL
jgi:hypothetical protein